MKKKIDFKLLIFFSLKNFVMYSNYSTKMEMEVSMQMKSGLSMKSNELSMCMCVFFNRQVMRSLGLNPTNKEITDLIAEVDKNGKLNIKHIFFSILSKI